MIRRPSSRWWVPLIIALVLAMPLLLTITGRHNHKEGPAEVPRSQMIQRDGSWCLQGTTMPFNGVMIETYETGELKVRSHITNGLLDGLSESWFTNGRPQRLEHFRAGISHGLRTKWHPNGNRLSEVRIVQGKLEGTFRRWHEDGSLHQEMQLANGEPEGVSRAYYPSGFLSAEARLHNGEVLTQKFWKDGEMKGLPLASVPVQ